MMDLGEILVGKPINIGETAGNNFSLLVAHYD